jgi:hypothetical protein
MPYQKQFFRSLFFIFLLACLLIGLAGTVRVPVNAAPQMQITTMDVIFNEIAWAGTFQSPFDEWIELYNTTGTDIDLSNWRIETEDGSPTILLSGTILANSFLLLERGTQNVTNVTGVVYTSPLLDDTGETLYLLNETSSVVDTVNWDGGMWPAGNANGTIPSMERVGIVLDADDVWATFDDAITFALDAGSNPIFGTPGQANWITTVTLTPSSTPTATLSPTLTRTPTKTYTPSKTRTATAIRTATRTRTPTRTPPPPPPPPLVAINEFVPRPGHDWNGDGIINTDDEYIELLNHGTVNVSLSGYSLDDEANIGSGLFRLPAITIKPGERIVFYGSETGLLLSDGGDGVRLLKPNGQLADAYNYFVVNRPDQSFCRLPDNGGLDDWTVNCSPTPGLKNALSGSFVTPPPRAGDTEPLCPIADTLPEAFALAECLPFGNNIWNRYYWDKLGWYGEMNLPDVNGKWDVYVD